MSFPVFIVGAPRSGTTLLYHMLLSSGGFAVYRTESRAYDVIRPKFGDLQTARRREAFLDQWTRGYKFDRTGLEEEEVRNAIMDRCHDTGDFLRIVMEAMAHDQGVERWADCTPSHALYLDHIQRDFPQARVIHIIRDGRDVALSLARQGWIRRLPGDTTQDVVVAALFWEWVVQNGREGGRRLVRDRYLEVRFEELVGRPEDVLPSLSDFIRHPLDLEEIRKKEIGSVGKPNTSFAEEEEFSPVGRWRDATRATIVAMEEHIGHLLRDLSYDVQELSERPIGARARGGAYQAYFTLKDLIRTRTPLGRVLVEGEILRRGNPDP